MILLIVELTWLVLVILMSIIGNCIVLYIIAKHLKLRTVTNEFIVALSIGDLFSAVLCMPVALLTTVQGTWIASPQLCVAHGTLVSMLGMHSTLIMTCITVERYFSVVRSPNRPIALGVAWIIIVVMILISLVFSIPWSVVRDPTVLDTYYKQGYRHCMYEFHGPDAPNGLAYSLVYMLLCYFVPCGAMTTSAWLMWRMIHHNACRIQPASSRPQQLRFSAEIRTAVTVITMVVLLLLTRGPYLILGIITALSGIPFSPGMDTAAICLFWTSCAINPIVYAVRNPNVRIILNIRRSSMGYRTDNNNSAPVNGEDALPPPHIPTVSAKVALERQQQQDLAVEVDSVSISTVTTPNTLFCTDQALLIKKYSTITTATTL